MSITGSKSLNSNNIEGVSTAGILDQLQNQVPINTINITNLQQITTGITYNATGDLTTIDNNLTILSTKILKSGYAAQANDDVANKLYVDNQVANTVSTSTVATSSIVLNGVDISTQLNQVPINANNITNLQQATTGITYNSTGDLTTIDNNVTHQLRGHLV